MKYCLYRNIQCEGCTMNRLFHRHRRLFSPAGERNCEQRARIIASHLSNTLSMEPNTACDRDAYALIIFWGDRVPDADLSLVMDLCFFAAQSKLLQDISARPDGQINELLTAFKMYLDRYEKIAPTEDVLNVYRNYYSVRLQFYHLSNQFSTAIKEYEDLRFSGDAIIVEDERIKSQYSSSKWKGSIFRSGKQQSRDVAEALMETVRVRGAQRENDFYILAKYLEHHIQSGTAKVGLDDLETCVDPKVLQSGDIYEIPSSIYAVNQTILYRDMFQARLLTGETDLANESLALAKEIVNNYKLWDQKKKIKEMEKRMGKKDGKTMVQIGSITAGDNGTIVIGDDNRIYQKSQTIEYEDLLPELDKLRKLGNADVGNEIDNAVKAIENKDEKTLKSALKKVAEKFGDIFTKVASEMVIAYMKQNGLLP